MMYDSGGALATLDVPGVALVGSGLLQTTVSKEDDRDKHGTYDGGGSNHGDSHGEGEESNRDAGEHVDCLREEGFTILRRVERAKGSC